MQCLTHRLTGALQQYFPPGLDWLKDTDPPLCCDVVTRWPTLIHPQRARKARLEAFFPDHHGRDPHRIEPCIQAILRAPALTADHGVIRPNRRLVEGLVAHLRGVWQALARGQQHPPVARFISSPDALEAPYACKHTTPWVGDKVHLTETCEEDLPHLITHVDTTIGPASDGAATPKIHAALQRRSLLPGTPIVDTGFLDAELLVESRDHYNVDLLGPTRLDDHWPARQETGFDAQHFPIDWDRHHAICPVGKTSTGWTPALDHRGNPVIKVKCATKDSRRCEPVTPCIRSTRRSPQRALTIRPQPQYQALHAARQREATDTFQAAYARRAGIEGTISRGTRSVRLRRTRSIGLVRVHLGHILAAAGLNVRRLGEWFLETARAKTRITPCARLMADAAGSVAR